MGFSWFFGKYSYNIIYVYIYEHNLKVSSTTNIIVMPARAAVFEVVFEVRVPKRAAKVERRMMTDVLLVGMNTSNKVPWSEVAAWCV